MPALHPPLAFKRGDTWEIDASLHYADGSPFNLGAGAVAEWKVEDGAGNVVLDLSIANGGIVVIPDKPGQCLITVTPVQSAAVAAGKYSDELRAIDPTGFVSTQAVGSIDVRKSFFV